MTVPRRTACPRCGASVGGDFKFCPACAYRLRPGAAPTPPPPPRKKTKTRTKPVKRVETAAKPAPEKAVDEKEVFAQRVLEAWRAHKQKKTPHAKKLGALLQDLRLKPAVTADMRAVLKEAEAAL